MTNVVLFIAKQFGLLWTCFPAISVEYHYIMWCLYNINYKTLRRLETLPKWGQDAEEHV